MPPAMESTWNPRQVSLAAGTVLDLSPPDTVRAAAAAGFDAAGVWFDPATWDDAVAAAVATRLADTGLAALDIEVGRITPDGDLSGIHRLLDAGAAVGARNVLVISLDDDLDRTADRFAAVCERASTLGLRVVLEFMRFLAVKTLDDAVHVVHRAAHPAGGILIDSLHLSRSGHTVDHVATLARAEPHLFPYVQLCDAVAEIPPADQLMEEALHGRLLPGEGALPLVELLAALPPAAPVSVELRSRALRDAHPDPFERARAVAAATRRLPGLGPTR